MGTWFKSINQKNLKKIMNYSKNSNEQNKKLMYFAKSGLKVWPMDSVDNRKILPLLSATFLTNLGALQ